MSAAGIDGPCIGLLTALNRGLMIAKGFASSGAKIYITGRRLEVLKEAASEFDDPTSVIP